MPVFLSSWCSSHWETHPNNSYFEMNEYEMNYWCNNQLIWCWSTWLIDFLPSHASYQTLIYLLPSHACPLSWLSYSTCGHFPKGNTKGVSNGVHFNNNGISIVEELTLYMLRCSYISIKPQNNNDKYCCSSSRDWLVFVPKNGVEEMQVWYFRNGHIEQFKTFNFLFIHIFI